MRKLQAKHSRKSSFNVSQSDLSHNLLSFTVQDVHVQERAQDFPFLSLFCTQTDPGLFFFQCLPRCSATLPQSWEKGCTRACVCVWRGSLINIQLLSEAKHTRNPGKSAVLNANGQIIDRWCIFTHSEHKISAGDSLHTSCCYSCSLRFPDWSRKAQRFQSANLHAIVSPPSQFTPASCFTH